MSDPHGSFSFTREQCVTHNLIRGSYGASGTVTAYDRHLSLDLSPRGLKLEHRKRASEPTGMLLAPLPSFIHKC